MFPPLNVTVGIFRLICRAISPPNMAHYIVAEQLDSCLVWSHYVLLVIYRTSPNVLEQTSDRLQYAIFSSNGDIRGDDEWRPWKWSALPVVFSMMTEAAASRSFWSSFRVVLCSWASLLTNFLKAWSEILWAPPACGRLMVEWCSFHLWIITSVKLIGTFKRWECRQYPVPLLRYRLIVTLLGELFTSKHHEMFIV